MKGILITVLLLMLSCFVGTSLRAQSTSPEQTIASLKAIRVSTLDSRLPRQRFGTWLQNMIGTGATIDWQISDCGMESKAAGDLSKSIPTCVEAAATLRDGRTVVIVVDASALVSNKRGKPVVHWISVENADGSTDVQSLRDLQVIAGIRAKR
jgi:hypothetical protein